jgi:hypothetical protein
MVMLCRSCLYRISAEATGSCMYLLAASSSWRQLPTTFTQVHAQRAQHGQRSRHGQGDGKVCSHEFLLLA